jgi:hypothetical protein
MYGGGLLEMEAYSFVRRLVAAGVAMVCVGLCALVSDEDGAGGKLVVDG